MSVYVSISIYIYLHTLTDICINIGVSLKKTLVKQKMSLTYCSPSKSTSSPVPVFIDASWYQSVLRLGAAVYTGDAVVHNRVIQKALQIQSSRCNDILTATCILCSSLHFSVTELAVLQEKTRKRRQFYARRQYQEH